MSFLEMYLSCALGIALSIVIPVLSSAVKKQASIGQAANVSIVGSFLVLVARAMKPYALLAAFSLATAVVIVAFAADSLDTWRSALIAGYLYDSTLQKITKA